MIEYLMRNMKRYMDQETYSTLMGKWDSRGDPTVMQNWVDLVSKTIGADNYEGLKKEFRDEKTEKSQIESSMHCTQTFSNIEEVQFKVDIGANNTMCDDIVHFEKYMTNILYGVVDKADNCFGN